MGADPADLHAPLEPLPRRAAGDRPLVRPAPHRAVLGWTPAVSLDEGIARLGGLVRIRSAGVTACRLCADGRPVFVSDNPAFDSVDQPRLLARPRGNPFGHSGRRIGDYYAGLVGDFRRPQDWKRCRVTPHDHNPVTDAKGNAEAFETIQRVHREGGVR